MNRTGWFGRVVESVRRRTGIGYRSTFRVGLWQVKRPMYKRSIHHKIVFEQIGLMLTDPHHSGVIRPTFCDHAVDQGIPSKVWEEVYSYFYHAGLLGRRWRLEFPGSQSREFRRLPPGLQGDRSPQASYSLRDEPPVVPQHDAQGVVLRHPEVTSSGPVVDSVEFWPEWLTDVQKETLLGKPYRCFADGAGIPCRFDPLETILLSENNFKLVYIRRI